MNITQWKERMRVAKERKVIDNMQEKLALEINDKAKKLRALSRTPGWRYLDEYFEHKEKLLRDKLELCKKEELVDVQSELKAEKELRRFIENAVKYVDNQ